MLPSFFNGKSESRSPETYMEIRNWIMKKFHFNPSVQIELEHLSELTVGELDARREVMEFLDYWGLINYHPFPHQEPAAMIVDSNASKDESGNMETLVEKLFKFEAVQSWTPTVPRMSMATPAMSSGLLPEPSTADELVKSEGPSVEYHCNSCAADCSRKRYHCQKQVFCLLLFFSVQVKVYSGCRSSFLIHRLLKFTFPRTTNDSFLGIGSYVAC